MLTSDADADAVAPVTLRVAARASQIKCKNRSIKQSIESLQSASCGKWKGFPSYVPPRVAIDGKLRFARIINKFNILIADSIFVVGFLHISAEL